jgi:hypothetical protein
MYKTIRSLHLLLASISLPFLLMYGVSAVQMAHSTWFDMKPAVHGQQLSLAPGLDDGRQISRALVAQAAGVRGEVTDIHSTATGVTLRLVLPGTVHEVRYVRSSGVTTVKTSTAGVMGMLNRLHHAAGLWHEPASLKLWGLAVAIVSASLLLTGASGLYMWFLRKTERRTGMLLLAANLIAVVVLLVMMRHAGP